MVCSVSAMVVLVFLYMLRVIFYGAYKFPREITWFTGVILLLVTIGFGFTGYLLPWDQKAYWATTVGTRIAGAPPLMLGQPMANHDGATIGQPCCYEHDLTVASA